MVARWSHRLGSLIVGGLIVLVAAVSANAATMHWSASVKLPHGVFSIDCPSASLCVAGTDEGLVVSTDPVSSAARWSQSAVPPAPAGYSGEVHGVACPSAGMCVAIGPHSILSSSNPAGGASAWRVARLSMPDSQYLVSLACEAANACVAVVGTTKLYRCCKAPHGGRIFVSSDPTGGSHAWREVKLHDVPDVVSCVPSFCMLGTDDGDMLHARKPTAGAFAWRGPHVLGPVGSGGNDELDSLGCARTGYCLAPIGGLTDRGALRTRHGLSWHESDWQFGQYLGGARTPAPGGVSCLASGFCAVGAVIDSSGKHPYGEMMTATGFGKRFTATRLAHASAGVEVACVTAQLCVAGTAAWTADYALSGAIFIGRS